MSLPAGLMSQAAYARHRNVNRSHINRLAKRGILVLRGKYIDVAASDAVLDDKPVDPPSHEPHGTAQLARAAVDAPTPGAQPGSFAQARTAEMVFRARLRKLEFETKSGKFLLSDVVRVSWFKVVRIIRDKMLALPAKLAPQLAVMSDPAEIRDFLTAEVIAILKSLQEEIRYQRN